jgi:S1-C subfamily serine protease
MHRLLSLCLLLATCLLLRTVAAEENPRITPTTRLVQKCLPAVVSLPKVEPGEKPGERRIHFGSGTIISPLGYVLTNAHVIRDSKEGPALLPGNRVLKYTTICTIPHSDLCVIKLHAEEALPYLPIGRSHDLMLGEPTLVIGNAAEMAHSASTGIVSGLARSTRTEAAILPDVVQTTAAINGGTSGGPLINALGEVIGVVTSRKPDFSNVGFAIAADHVRTVLPAMLEPEERYNFWFGAKADPLAERCQVNQLAAGSPAAEAGLQRGDVMVRIDKHEVRSPLDLTLVLIGQKTGQELTLSIEREGMPLELKVTLKPLPLPEPQKETDQLVSGVLRKEYAGQWQRLPDFASQKVLAEKVVENFAHQAKDNYAFQFHSLLKVPEEGLYWFAIRSDDGSRLRIANRLIADNDESHGIRDVSGVIRLPAGLHPIDVEYFQGNGAADLKVYWQGPKFGWQEIPADVLQTKKRDE